MKNNRRIIYILALLLLAAFSFRLALPAEARAQGAPSQAKRVIVISLDGLDVRYLQKRDEYGLKIPTLRRLMNDGVLAQVVGVYPSVTYPSHTTIVTGATLARHGIYGNEIFEPPGTPQTGSWHWFARDIRAETLWDAATRKHLSTALISWPVSIGAGDYSFPEIWKPGGTREETSAVIKANAHPSGLIEELERRDPQLYSKQTRDESDDIRTRFAEYIIETKRPQVTLVHLFDLDHFEHEKGPFTADVFAILEKVDGYVGRILNAARRAGTLDETAIFIVSDHGFMPTSKVIHPGVILARAGLLKVSEERDAQGRTRAIASDGRAWPYVSGGSCAIILRDPKDKEAASRALAAFKDFAQGEGRGTLRVIEGKELRRFKTNPDAAFVLEASDGYYFEHNYTGQPVTPSPYKGQHGYLPERYYTTFIASGAGVTKRGTLGTIRLIDEGPTIARTIGLKLKDAEGRASPLN